MRASVPAAMLAMTLAMPAPATAGRAQAGCAALEAWLQGQGEGPMPFAAPRGACSAPDGPGTLICRWEFAYRDAAARAALEAMAAAVLACAGAGAERGADQPVNHPDSYDLRRFAVAGREVALSLKDKAALGKSFVFLRIAPAGGG